jgi:hypothetical protein
MTHSQSSASRAAIGLTLCLIASPGLARQTPQFHVTRDTVLVDERFDLDA